MHLAQPGNRSRSRSVLVVENETAVQDLLYETLKRAGYRVTLSFGVADALDRVSQEAPDLIVTGLLMPNMDGLELLTHLRDNQATWAIPVIVVTSNLPPHEVVTGLAQGADDYLVKPFQPSELLVRVRARIERPAIPRDAVVSHRRSGVLTEKSVLDETEREMARAGRRGTPGCLALLKLLELSQLSKRLGKRAESTVVKQTATIVQATCGPLEIVGRDRNGRFLILLPETDPEQARRWLERLSRAIEAKEYRAGSERLKLTPIIGMAPFAPQLTAEDLRNRARVALRHAACHLDLVPACYKASMVDQAGSRETQLRWETLARQVETWLYAAIAMFGALALPCVLYILLASFGVDLTRSVYLAVVVCLFGANAAIWVESWMAGKRQDPPDTPAVPYPPATAIIAAYLPNEAATIVDTVRAFLRLEYPAPLQIILAYNTDRDLPIEATLRQIAKRDDRFVLMRVAGSNSKAHNINASLTRVTGEFVGLFDADHHPDPDSFSRAWRWLSDGWDVVQGHCLVRNGHTSWVARLAAVEFESIYAVSHPGRARLHKFGIFGGRNGYWKTSVLSQTRMRSSMLTEDIDSSIRAIREGYRIVSDPFLVSRELAPLTLTALWTQRMRWSQGWFQVCLRHTLATLRSPKVSLRQKLGHVHLLTWNQCFPWVSLQILPLLIYWIWWSEEQVNWVIPLFVITTLFTLGTGPMQCVVAYRLAHPELKRQKGWFVFYFLVSPIYAEFKNLIVRVAQLKEIVGERRWRITPRLSSGGRTWQDIRSWRPGPVPATGIQRRGLLRGVLPQLNKTLGLVCLAYVFFLGVLWGAASQV